MSLSLNDPEVKQKRIDDVAANLGGYKDKMETVYDDGKGPATGPVL